MRTRSKIPASKSKSVAGISIKVEDTSKETQNSRRKCKTDSPTNSAITSVLKVSLTRIRSKTSTDNSTVSDSASVSSEPVKSDKPISVTTLHKSSSKPSLVSSVSLPITKRNRQCPLAIKEELVEEVQIVTSTSLPTTPKTRRSRKKESQAESDTIDDTKPNISPLDNTKENDPQKQNHALYNKSGSTTVNDSRGYMCPVLKEVYEELDNTFQGDNLSIRNESNIVEKVFNEYVKSEVVNDSMQKQEMFLSNVNLLRNGIEKAWLNRREERSEALSRRALGRLRPNPRRPKYFTDMVPSGASRHGKRSRDDILIDTMKRSRMPGVPRDLGVTSSVRPRRKTVISSGQTAASKVIARSRACVVTGVVRRPRGRPKSCSAPGSVAGSESSESRKVSTRLSVRLRPKKTIGVGLRRKGELSSYITKRFCYNDETITAKAYDQSKRKRKIADKVTDTDSSKLSKKSKIDVPSSKSTPVKNDRNKESRENEKNKFGDNSHTIIKKKSSVIQSEEKKFVSDNRESTNKVSNSREMKNEEGKRIHESQSKEEQRRRFHDYRKKMPKPLSRQYLQAPPPRQENQVTPPRPKLNPFADRKEFNTMLEKPKKTGHTVDANEWPPRNRKLSILDRLILGLECELVKGNDEKSVQVRGLSKPHFDCLRERIRKSGYFFGYIQYYPEEESQSGRDEYDCCITSDESRKHRLSMDRNCSTSPSTPEKKKSVFRKQHAPTSIPANSATTAAAQKIARKARFGSNNSPPKSGAAKRKFYPRDESMSPDDSNWPKVTQADSESDRDDDDTLYPNDEQSAPGNKIKRLQQLQTQSPNRSHISQESESPEYPTGEFSSPEEVSHRLSASTLIRRPGAIIEEETQIYRRHSPKKVIRKVYTGSSTVPKILNRKRPGAPVSTNSVGPQRSSVEQQSHPSSSSASAKLFTAPVSSGSNTAMGPIISSVTNFRRNAAPTPLTVQSAIRSSGASTNSSMSTVVSSQSSITRHESQEFWRLKGVEQNQIMDKHRITPATAMTASEIMKLKKIEAETAQHGTEFTCGNPSQVAKIFKATNPRIASQRILESVNAPKLEIDEEETDDDFEFNLPPSQQHEAAYYSDKAHPGQTVMTEQHQNSTRIVYNPSASSGAGQSANIDLTTTPTKSDDEDNLNKGVAVTATVGAKRTVIHKFHTFRKILPKAYAPVPSERSRQFPLITSHQGRPMVPPATAYSTIVLKDDNSQVTKSPGKLFRAAQRACQASNTSLSETNNVVSEVDTQAKRGSTQLLKSLLEGDRDLPGPHQQLPSPTAGTGQQPWNQLAHQSRGTWQVAKNARTGLTSQLRHGHVSPTSRDLLVSEAIKTESNSEPEQSPIRSFSPPPVMMQIHSSNSPATSSNQIQSLKACSIQIVDHANTPCISKPTSK